jgi:hypothetical protein
VNKLTNPTICIKPLAVGDKNFVLIDDGVLIGGTKQRLLGKFVGTVDFSEFVYAGPSIGIAQLALAYACSLWNKRATVFLNSHSSNVDPYTKLAIQYGAQIRYAPRVSGRTLADTQAASKAYCDKRKRCLLLPFGLKSDPGEIFFDVFREAIVAALPKELEPPKRLWITCGSGFLFSVLHSIWPDTEFLIVQVGRTIWQDQLDGKKAKKFIAPERFGEMAVLPPPYNTPSRYDGKLWQFVLEHGKDGDHIWNCASA